MSSDLVDLNGATMGTRWHLRCPAGAGLDRDLLQAAIQGALDAVDAQMSLWKPDSDLNRLNAAPVEEWVALGDEITRVLARALEIEAATGGAFDIAVGAAVVAWGFGPAPADPAAIEAVLTAGPRPRASAALELDRAGRRARRRAEVRFDLNGIAKGFGADRMVEVARGLGVTSMVAELDGDLRVVGSRPDGEGWPIAVEVPEHGVRAAHSMFELSDTAIATSGDYRHWIELGGKKLSHTMQPEVGAPLNAPPASVTVLAEDGATADAWATALMVLGRERGTLIARANGIKAMFLEREGAV